MMTPHDKIIVFPCECGGHGVAVHVFDWDSDSGPSVLLGIWRSYRNPRWRWADRLRHIWYIIHTGHPYVDDVVLDPDIAEKLARRILAIIEERDDE